MTAGATVAFTKLTLSPQLWHPYVPLWAGAHSSLSISLRAVRA